jgi:hypothetical protein
MTFETNASGPHGIGWNPLSHQLTLTCYTVRRKIKRGGVLNVYAVQEFVVSYSMVYWREGGGGWGVGSSALERDYTIV